MNKWEDQLRKQESLDKKLRLSPCQDLVNNYLFHRRSLSRQQYNLVKDGGSLNAYKNIQKNLDEVTADQQRMENIFTTDNPCDELRKYLTDIRNT